VRKVEIQLLQFDELSPRAKAKARAWYRQDNDGLRDDWYSDVYADFIQICGILGISLGCHLISRHDGTLTSKPSIWFTGFSCQGDGACFAGTYSGRAEACVEIRDHAPEDVVLHTIADVLQIDFVEPYEDLTASIVIETQGRYCHSSTMHVTSGLYQESDGDEFEISDDRLRLYEGQLRRLADWLYKQLEAEHEAMTSDETIEENILCNNFMFLSDGTYFPQAEHCLLPEAYL